MSNQNNPLVSVIIPCYNHEQFVQECIQSVIDQDYKNIELIIIDDGSKDQSVQKIEEMRSQCEKRFVRFEFRHRPNKGLCATLNEALDLIQGEYVAISASDDLSLQNRISVSLDAIRQHEADVIFGNAILMSANREISIPHPHFHKISFDDLFLRKFIPYAPTSFFDVLSLKQVGGFDTSYKIEDYPLWLKMTCLHMKLIAVPDVLIKYRAHENNLSSNLDLMEKEVQKILGEYKHVIDYEDAIKIFNSMIFYINSISNKKKSINILLSKKVKINKDFIKGTINLIIPIKFRGWFKK
ncbi:glycosyltransferase family 2 protein [Wohlfahrtiimonas chitiniclastica]|uniref:glycosyltransferase family 2 protein n=1 Tax=Wohlfahrtiimonas chitiniclastica TaxID=400946 RepID=UPI000B985204|nr:glycosyltransferase [Wohlfahrtiimonas chitiniclastica]OYQ74963.1 hypothetical protein B9T18_06920 [Wohlfahrtiimonas chitiniclastica]